MAYVVLPQLGAGGTFKSEVCLLDLHFDVRIDESLH